MLPELRMLPVARCEYPITPMPAESTKTVDCVGETQVFTILPAATAYTSREEPAIGERSIEVPAGTIPPPRAPPCHIWPICQLPLPGPATESAVAAPALARTSTVLVTTSTAARRSGLRSGVADGFLGVGRQHAG